MHSTQFMRHKRHVGWIKLFCTPVLLFVTPTSFANLGTNASSGVKAIDSSDMTLWSLALIAVLGLFLLSAWGFKHLQAGGNHQSHKMRITDAISLGLREKILLLQVGKKQLVLGITPGRIETLLVLEGDDCLVRDNPDNLMSSNGFSQKLMQAIKARRNDSSIL